MKNCPCKFYLLFALTNVVESNDTFKGQTTWPLVADSEITTLKARNRLVCVSHLESRDSGFAFNQSDHTCYLLHCANPNVTDVSENMSNIQVYLKEANFTLARGKPANMSTILINGGMYTYEAGKAVDGIYLPDGVSEFTSIAVSDSGASNPWWRVDLEQIYCIWGVNILNRAYVASQHRNRNKDVDVTVSRDETQLMYDINPDSSCNYFDGSLNQYYTLITCIQPMRGQFVQIQYRPGSNAWINLYEIEVFGV